MAVRRLDPDQPTSFAFTPDNLAWAKATMAKYPAGKQASAVVPLLWRAQEQAGGWLPEPALRAVADMLGMAYIRAYEIATFYTMFQLSPVGKKAHVQVCGTTPCMLRGSGELIEVCKSRIAAHAHELSADGNFSWEEVECLGVCANAPLVQICKDTYEDLTPAQLEKILDGFVKGKPEKPGPQTGRQTSSPEGGPTTLKDPSLYDGSTVGAWKHRFAELGSAAPSPAVNIKPSLTAPVTAATAGKSDPTPKAPPMNTGAAALVANAGLVPDLEARAQGKPLSAGAIENLKFSGPRTGIGTGYVTADVVIGAESAGDIEQPALLAQPRGGRPDDLKLIWGIGPKVEQALNALGIHHFDQIAAWTEKNVKWADLNLEDFRGRVVRDKWIEQAKKLAAGWRPASGIGEKPKG